MSITVGVILRGINLGLLLKSITENYSSGVLLRSLLGIFMKRITSKYY